ncbi:MAG TPA: helix-turn-helix domain-containing protein [Candidatus Limnocylindrales bacterium]|nr:helix-turn-helix domain-containing protein [Candidatus Limnocylindrales bacterium]
MPDNATHQRILDAAERLFAERGLGAVSLQDIAREVSMRHASLYYYAPRGKEQLYVEAMERSLRRHGEGLTMAIIAAGDDFRAQLHAIARWFATSSPLDLGRIVHADLPAIAAAADAERLMATSLDTVRMPIAAAIRNAARRGLIEAPDPEFAAMALVALLQSVHNIPRRFLPSDAHVIAAAQACADMLLFGWLRR